VKNDNEKKSRIINGRLFKPDRLFTVKNEYTININSGYGILIYAEPKMSQMWWKFVFTIL